MQSNTSQQIVNNNEFQSLKFQSLLKFTQEYPDLQNQRVSQLHIYSNKTEGEFAEDFFAVLILNNIETKVLINQVNKKLLFSVLEQPLNYCKYVYDYSFQTDYTLNESLTRYLKIRNWKKWNRKNYIHVIIKSLCQHRSYIPQPIKDNKQKQSDKM